MFSSWAAQGDRHCSAGVRRSLSTLRRPETPTDSHTQAGRRQGTGTPVQAATMGVHRGPKRGSPLAGAWDPDTPSLPNL